MSNSFVSHKISNVCSVVIEMLWPHKDPLENPMVAFCPTEAEAVELAQQYQLKGEPQWTTI